MPRWGIEERPPSHQGVTEASVGFVLPGALRGFDGEGGQPGTRTDEAGLRTAFTGRDEYLVAIDAKWTHLAATEGNDAGVVRLALALEYCF